MKRGDTKYKTIKDLFAESAKDKNGCIVWLKFKDRGGYGFASHKNKVVRAHRLAWEFVNGKIPNGLLVCHSCDNPSCVNPKHLFLGTHKDNRADCLKKMRQAKGDTAGPRLHPEAYVNTRSRGSSHYNAKLREQDILKIRTHAGSYQHIANIFGVSKSLIYQICKNKAWKVL